LASVERAPDLFAKFVAAHRALNLASMLRDESRAKWARDALLALHRSAVAERKLWWSLYDRIENDRHAGFTEEELQGIVADLEDLLRLCSDASSPETFNPHHAQGIAERLGRHYARLKNTEEERRLHRKVAEAFESMAGISGAMAGAVFLQTAVNSYRRAGMSDDSKRARRLMEQKIGQAREEMTPIVIKTEVKNEDLKAFVDAVVVDGIGQSLANMAAAFLPKTSEMEELVESVAEAAPISAHVGTMIMAADHVAAKIGSVSEDGRGV
jgi:lysyl-tRNA synthetase class 1